jgi:lipoprotein-anchoring transpeptidase ErfK/SrfK
MISISRRHFLASAAAASCFGTSASGQAVSPSYQLPEAFMPRYVKTDGGVAPNELHVLPSDFALLWTLPDRRAIRYTVGIGRPGLYESGEFFVGAKKTWPEWTPTDEMIEREPHLYEQWKDGMPGGPGNPLGARALYLFTPQRGDTFLRIHGTHDPSGLGREVSNGCARLMNSHIMHLYDRVPLGSRVVLHPKA